MPNHSTSNEAATRKSAANLLLILGFANLATMGKPLPVISSQAVCVALAKAGLVEIPGRGKGSHTFLLALDAVGDYGEITTTRPGQGESVATARSNVTNRA